MLSALVTSQFEEAGSGVCALFTKVRTKGAYPSLAEAQVAFGLGCTMMWTSG